MARGRMLNKKISMNGQVAELEHAVGPYGALFYTWLIAHLDVEGRMHGNPGVLKGMVVPRIDGCTLEVITETLAVANTIGLLEWYEVDGDCYVSYPKFADNQVGLRVKREAGSGFPPPSGVTPELLRSRSGVGPAQSNGMESNGMERKRIDPELRKDISKVLEHYLKHFPRRDKQTKDPKSRAKVKARLKDGYSVEQLIQAIEGNRKSSHHVDGGYDSIELIFRDAKHVDQFIDLAENGDKPKKGTNNNGYHPWEMDIDAAAERFANKEIPDDGF